MEYIRVFSRAVGWNWVRVPGLIFGFGSILVAILKWQGIATAIRIPTQYLLVITAIVIVAWFLVGLLHFAVVQNREIANFHLAWDRSGRHLTSIQDALRLIASRIPERSGDDTDFHKAAVKLRQIGLENQIKIVGHVYDEELKTLSEHYEDISPVFWKKNRLNVDAVVTGDVDLPQTMEDTNSAIEIRVQPVYGQLKIQKHTLEAMFPAV